MSFNFDERVERNHTDSEKWLKYSGQDIIPLWVADTDFKTAPQILNALTQRVAEGIFGYADDQGALAEATVNWVQRHYAWSIEAQWVVPLPAIRTALTFILQCFTQPAHRSICHTPIYPPFTDCAKQLARQQLILPWQFTGNEMHLPPLPKSLVGNEKLLFLCNPHNPGGKIYQRAELLQLAEFAKQHDLLVVSDEIYADLVLDASQRHLPFASLGDDCAHRSITLLSPVKAFNIAGLGGAVAIIPSPDIRAKFTAAAALQLPPINRLASIAATAAWQQGDDWLAAQIEYLRANRALVSDCLAQLPQLRLTLPQAGFLAWIDTAQLGVADPIAWFEQFGLGLTDGAPFGNPHAVRLNFGCQRALLTQALQRLAAAVHAAPPPHFVNRDVS